MSDPVLVCGATGSQGGAVIDALLAAGRDVRAFVRDPDAPRAAALRERGVGIAVGVLADREALQAAMSGVTATFGLTVVGRNPADEVAQGAAIVAAAQESGLAHLVLGSVASAPEAPQVPHFKAKTQIEALARDSGVPTTVVAPTWFFENLLGSRADIAAGVLPIAIAADRVLQAVALADVGRLVAAILDRGPATMAGQRIEVAGDALTPAEMASALSEAVAVEVRVERVPLEAIAKRSQDMAAMYTFLDETGYHVDIAKLLAAFPEVGWRSFGAWAAAQTWR